MSVEFKPTRKADVPTLALSESGQSMMLWSLIGAVEYRRDDSEELAKHLDSMAKMVRENK